MNFQLINNESSKQYEFHVEDKIARIEYIRVKESIYLTHTEVPISLEGKGIASSLIKATLAEIKSNNWTLVPLCPFVASYIKKHPEWKSLLQDGFKID